MNPQFFERTKEIKKLEKYRKKIGLRRKNTKTFRENRIRCNDTSKQKTKFFIDLAA